MQRYTYERLSAQDASFLWAEGEHEPMHVGAVAIFESGPLRHERGGVDVGSIRSAVESVLHWIPRYRQKLAWVPLERWPVWIDDRHFDLRYHIRHLALPRPGTLDQLKEMASRIMARHLDRSRALWEMWVIEGLEDGTQFALLNKTHHCMIDGAAGADLSQILFSSSPSVERPEPLPYMPRPAPSGAQLVRDGLRQRMGLPLDAARNARGWLADPRGRLAKMRRRSAAVGELLRFAFRPASETPLNGALSPHRRLDWLTMPLDDVKELRRVLGCTVNDVVLATVCGALRRYLFQRRVDAAKLDFRVAAPVSVRHEEHERRQGNHVSSWILRLPLAETDPLRQLAAVRERTAELKRRESALGVETIMRALEWLPPALIARGVGLTQGPANLMVTNVPGPQVPLYMVGARLLGMYPVVPLLPGSGLGIALFSYEGKLCWGFNGDFELLADLSAFVGQVGAAFEELRRATVSHFLERRTASPDAGAAPAGDPEPRSPPRPEALDLEDRRDHGGDLKVDAPACAREVVGTHRIVVDLQPELHGEPSDPHGPPDPQPDGERDLVAS